MSEEVTYQHGDGCCACKCSDGEIGLGGCCLSCCCPCISYYGAAEKIGESGILYGALPCIGFGFVSVMMLGMKVEEKRNIKRHGGGWHFCYSCFDGCSCQSCRVANECAVFEKEGAVAAPSNVEMTR